MYPNLCSFRLLNTITCILLHLYRVHLCIFQFPINVRNATINFGNIYVCSSDWFGVCEESFGFATKPPRSKSRRNSRCRRSRRRREETCVLQSRADTRLASSPWAVPLAISITASEKFSTDKPAYGKEEKGSVKRGKRGERLEEGVEGCERSLRWKKRKRVEERNRLKAREQHKLAE